jgi:hypothetical protein
MHARSEMLDLVVKNGRAPASSRATWSAASASVVGPRRGARHRRLRQRLLPFDQRQGLQRHRRLARLQAGRGVRQPLLHADPSHLHSGYGRHQSKLTLMSESLRNDGRVLGPQEGRRHTARRPDSRGRARLLPRAQIPELRQPGAPRHRFAQRQGGLRRRPRRRARGARASISISPRPSRAWAQDGDRAALRQSLPDVREDHRRRSLQTPMRIYPACTTPWAACGWTTT